MHNYPVCDESSSGEPRQRGVWRHLCGVIMAVLVVGASYSTAGAQTQPRAYVANRCNNTVSVIDTATNTVIATIAGVACPAGIAITTQARVPLSIEECKNGGWRTFGPPAGPFRNQGECVSYVRNRSKNRQ